MNQQTEVLDDYVISIKDNNVEKSQESSQELSSSNSDMINITYDDIENNIETLNNSVTSMRDDWNKIKNQILIKLSNSWAGSDCEEYIKKITNMDTKIENSFKALELLSKTYEETKNQVFDSQEAIQKYIETI